MVDSSMLSQQPSRAPYAHWSWHHAQAANTSGYDCVLAQKAYSYDWYLGDGTLAQLADATLYARCVRHCPQE
jgi:hypothetical protein